MPTHFFFVAVTVGDSNSKGAIDHQSTKNEPVKYWMKYLPRQVGARSRKDATRVSSWLSLVEQVAKRCFTRTAMYLLRGQLTPVGLAAVRRHTVTVTAINPDSTWNRV